ncbi:uncharacterized protein E5676_scaffold120G001290 [Cucumis melo var. makuwa]|uniref:Uncharacterized protein n=1 Tax=Cucumis melo var. makuwa TaxID=1194695 RepID=A0A5D3DZY6_CUCMM|nr:uncharacterized protein E5676_scaffold120G001290 [Cucumis melo var. makuwa]
MRRASSDVIFRCTSFIKQHLQMRCASDGNFDELWTHPHCSVEMEGRRKPTMEDCTLLVYFTPRNGTLLELSELEPQDHGVAAIADVACFRTEIVSTISSVGDLYEYDRNSKPLWNKHVWKDRVVQDLRLIPSRGCYIHSLNGDPSISLFLLTKTDSDDDGFLTLKDMIENPFVFYSSVFTEDEMGYYPRHDEFC